MDAVAGRRGRIAGAHRGWSESEAPVILRGPIHVVVDRSNQIHCAAGRGQKGRPMSSGLPATPREGRIIPFRSPSASPMPDAAGPSLAAQAAPPRDERAEAARHYLKFMLPSIPIATFVLSFVYWYLILGMRLVRPEHVATRVPDGA